jgi:hypothetical protein
LLEAATENLLTGLRDGVERAVGRGRQTLVSVTVPVDGVDPCAVVFASRLASDRWFCWEQPDREFALAGLGVAAAFDSRGSQRFADLARECLRAGRDAIVDEPPGLPAGAGPVWLGGFAFDPGGGSSSVWSSLPPASMFLPEISLCRSGERVFLTVNAIIGGEDDGASAVASAVARVGALRIDPLPLLDPHPTARTEIRSGRGGDRSYLRGGDEQGRAGARGGRHRELRA